MREPLLLYRSVQFQSSNSFDFESAVNDHQHHHLLVPNDNDVGDDRYDNGGGTGGGCGGDDEGDDEDFYHMTDFDYQRQSLLQVERHSTRYILSID